MRQGNAHSLIFCGFSILPWRACVHVFVCSSTNQQLVEDETAMYGNHVIDLHENDAPTRTVNCRREQEFIRKTLDMSCIRHQHPQLTYPFEQWTNQHIIPFESNFIGKMFSRRNSTQELTDNWKKKRKRNHRANVDV